MSERTYFQDESFHANIDARRIGRVYAEALFNAADKVGALDDVLLEFDSLVRDVFPVKPQLEEILTGAGIGPTAKRQILENTFKDRATPTFYNFLLVLNDHERLDLLRAIWVELRDLLNERTRKVRVIATTAVPLDDGQKQQVADAVRHALQYEPVIVNRVNPDILGGIILRVHDWQYDGSVSTKLQNLRTQILTRSSHEIQSRRDRFSSAD